MEEFPEIQKCCLCNKIITYQSPQNKDPKYCDKCYFDYIEGAEEEREEY